MINHIKPFEAVASATTSRPDKELEERLLTLEGRVNQALYRRNNNGMYLYDCKLEAGTVAPAVVYYNPTNDTYMPAVAGLFIDSDGNYTNTISTLAVGIVVRVTGNRGDILIDGAHPFTEEELKLLVEPGSSYLPGVIYYVSSVYRGRITNVAPAVNIQVGIGSKDTFMINPVYSTPKAFEKSDKAFYSCRPVGGVRRRISAGAELVDIQAFDGLVYDPAASVWKDTKTSDISDIRRDGFVYADFEAYTDITTPLYLMLYVNTTGHVYAIINDTPTGLHPCMNATGFRSYSTSLDLTIRGVFPSLPKVGQPYIKELSRLDTGERSFPIYADLGINPDDESITDPIGRFHYRFTTTNTSRNRIAVFKLPDSFMGWKPMVNRISGTQVWGGPKDYTEEFFPSGTNVVSPSPEITPYYYSALADPQFKRHWPSQPIEKAVFIMNGVEQETSLLQKAGEGSSSFDKDSFSLGVSENTLFWPFSSYLATPWDYVWNSLSSDESVTLEARLAGLAGATAWYWYEDTDESTPIKNVGWFYSNKYSNLFKSEQVATLSVQSPIKAVNLNTGAEASPGSSLSGNILLYLDRDQSFYYRYKALVDMKVENTGTPIPIFTNNTEYDIIITSVILVNKYFSTASGYNPSLLVGDAVSAVRLDIDANSVDTPVLPQTTTNLKANNQIVSLSPFSGTTPTPVYKLSNTTGSNTVYFKVVRPTDESNTYVTAHTVEVILTGYYI